MSKSFSEKQTRALKKKARRKQEQYLKTNDTRFLQERDQLNDQAQKVIENQKRDQKVKERKKKEVEKSDEQLLNEANSYNRKIKNEAQKKFRVDEKKKEGLRSKRSKIKLQMKEKKQRMEKENEENTKREFEYREALLKEKKAFFDGYRKEHPDVSDSNLQKEFVRHCKKIKEFNHIMKKFLSDGCTKEEVEQIEKELINNDEINVSPRL
tara:strand:+ start:152 stop:781 length:630 start_codon:yes stop_codon:yes gene_type:complete